MADNNENGNGRVTMAILSTKLDTVIDKLDELAQRQWTDHERISTLEGELRRTNDRISAWQAGQSALSLLLSGLATWVGVRH